MSLPADRIRQGILSLPAFLLLLLSTTTHAQSGSFTAVSYNVAGLPPFVACCDPDNSIPAIAADVFAEPWDIVAFQEAFVHGVSGGSTGQGSLYYDTLMGVGTPMSFDFPPADAALQGNFSVSSGLGRLSTLSISQALPLPACEDVSNDPTNYCRQKWNMLTGNDALSEKGYSFARHEIATGSLLDVYNWHAQAGSSEATVRADNVQQLIDEINLRSTGNAVIVLGDTNSTYDRTTDVIRKMLTDTTGTGGGDAPLKDVWVELVRGQLGIPTQGGTPLFPCDEEMDPAEMARTEWAGPNCEWRDKIFYRGSPTLTLTATQYFVITDYQHMSGADYSDHYPTGTVFDYTVVPEPAAALLSLAALTSLVALRRSRRS